LAKQRKKRKGSNPCADLGDVPNGDFIGKIAEALENSLRRLILTELLRGPASSTMLSRKFDLKVANIAYHLCGVLGKRCGVAIIVEEIQRRGAYEKVYALNPAAYPIVFAALRADVADREPGHFCTWRSIAVDENGQREIGATATKFTEQLGAIEKRCATLDPDSLVPLSVGAAAITAPPLPSPAS
jgi:hypothetical protein